MTPQVQEIFLRVGIENKISQNLIKATLYGSAKDFLVEEVFPDYRCSVGGGGSEIQPSFLKEYIHATLVKEGISTFDSCQTLCEENNIPVGEISYCGLKDTLGLTAQRICIPNKGKFKKTKFDKFFLKDFRESGKRLKVRGHKGNHFVVRATNVKESPASSEKLLNGFGAEIKRGLPNFYGLQRFGLRQNNHVLGKLILKKKYGEFIFRFLTDTCPYESKRVREARKDIGKNFGNLRKCLEAVGDEGDLASEKWLIKDLMEKGELLAIKNMRLSNFFMNSLSGYLFNLALSDYLRGGKKAGNIKLEKIGSRTKFDRTNLLIYSPVLEREGVALPEFAELCPELRVDGRKRDAFFFPENFKFRIEENDIVVEFDLGIGEYASLFLDFIFDNRSRIKLN